MSLAGRLVRNNQDNGAANDAAEGAAKEGCHPYSFLRTRTEQMSATKATRFKTALAACEYSQWVRSAIQFPATQSSYSFAGWPET